MTSIKSSLSTITRLVTALLLLHICGKAPTISAAFRSDASGSHHDSEERLIGWAGDTYQPVPLRHPWVQQISWKPRAFVYHNFLSEAEARHVAGQAAPTMKRSSVVGPNGSAVFDDYRTSFGTFLLRGSDPIILSIQQRVATWTHVPVIHQEDMQVLRYANGQYYHAHMDSLLKDSPRQATVLIYLADPIDGGETSFPQAVDWVDPEMPNVLGPFSKCAQGKVAFRPRRGDALLFWSIKPDSVTEDPFSEHEGCPVMAGVKWTATVWVHTVPFRPEEWNGTHFIRDPGPPGDAGLCEDADVHCEGWAANGECDKNPGYMKGDTDQVGKCARACKTCEPCAGPTDKACHARNRKKLGLLVFDQSELDTPLNWVEADLASAKGLPFKPTPKTAAEKASSMESKTVAGKGAKGSANVGSSKNIQTDSDPALSQSAEKGRLVTDWEEGLDEDDGDTSY